MTAIRKEARSHGLDENSQSGSPGLTGEVLCFILNLMHAIK